MTNEARTIGPKDKKIPITADNAVIAEALADLINHVFIARTMTEPDVLNRVSTFLQLVADERTETVTRALNQFGKFQA